MMLDYCQTVYFQTDASFHGFGAVCSDDWFAGSWSDCPAPDSHSSPVHDQHCSHAGHAIDPSLRSNINYLELFSILIAVRRWGSRWLNKRVYVEMDNTQAMAFINNGTCKNSIAMSWLREIFWISVRYNFHLFYQANSTNTPTDLVVCSSQPTLTHVYLFTISPSWTKLVSAAAYAGSTLATRRSQWRVYLRFCSAFGLVPIPATNRTVIRFLIHLPTYCKYSTIINYLSAINVLHRHFGHHVTFQDVFAVKPIVRGLRRTLGDAQEQKLPITPKILLRLRSELLADRDSGFWAAMLIGF